MTLLMFLILAAYYLLKTAREVFILSEGGAEVKSYSSAGQAMLLLFLVPAYGAFASRVNRVQLVQWVTLFFVSHIVLFMLALSAGMQDRHRLFPLGRHLQPDGDRPVLGVRQRPLHARTRQAAVPADRRRRQPRRVGRIGARRAVDGALGPRRLMVGAAVTLVACVFLSRVVNRVTEEAGECEAPPRPKSEEPLGKGSGFGDDLLGPLSAADRPSCRAAERRQHVGRIPVRQATSSRRPWSCTPTDAAAREQLIGAAYSRLFSTVNLVGFLLQMFVVSRVFKFLGVGKSLFIHPIVALAGYLMMLRAPSITAMGWLKVADNSLDYSLGNTTKQALWLPTSREAKYKAKQAVDSFFVRAGDVIQAGLVFVGERLSFAVPAFAAVNLVLAGVWLGVVALLNSQLRAKAEAAGTQEL